MNRILLLIRNGAVALSMALAFAACDSSTSALEDNASDGVAQFSMILASELGLSDAQFASVENTASRHSSDDPRDPAYLWYLAGELSQTLSEEQKQKLIDRALAMGVQFGERGLDGPFGRPGDGFGGMGPLAPGIPMHGGPNGLVRAGAGPHDGIGQALTQEQRDALHALREEYRDRVREAIQAVRDASTDAEREQKAEELRALTEEIRAAVDAWLDATLTDEQKAQIEAERALREEARLAAREAVREAIDQVLGPGMADVIESIHDGFVNEVETARSSGGTEDEIRARIEQAAQLRDEALARELGESGYEIYLIHKALAMRASHMGRGKGPGGQGGPGGPGGNRGLEGQNGPGGNGGRGRPGAGGPGGTGGRTPG